jgi:hypothetical protein
MERLVVQVAPGKFDVIEGRQLNAEPLTRVEADRLAHEPVKPAAKAPEAPSPPPKRKPAVQSATTVAPAVDLRTTRADQAGGSCGFRIKGGPTW